MEAEVFTASRLTKDNLLFPTKIVVTDRSVMRKKRSWFSLNEESVHLSNVATVNITTGLLWSDIRIESSGGSDPLESHGHSKSDARRIKELIESRQGPVARGATGDAADTMACPKCAETIKSAATVCRFCGHELR